MDDPFEQLIIASMAHSYLWCVVCVSVTLSLTYIAVADALAMPPSKKRAALPGRK